MLVDGAIAVVAIWLLLLSLACTEMFLVFINKYTNLVFVGVYSVSVVGMWHRVSKSCLFRMCQ